MKTDFIEIARFASQAPSGHNTQPWKFHLADDAIIVIPNFNVALPVVDGDNRELFISLGCAIENLCIAASHFSYETLITKCSNKGITIKLTKSCSIVEDPLFYQIEKRQTNRSIYNGDKISDRNLEELKSICKVNRIQFYFTEIGNPFANMITEQIMNGNEIQMKDTAFKKELLSWMRFNRKQVEATQDGLSYQVFGNPPLPMILAKPIVSLFLKPDTQNKSDRKKIDSSSHFILCTIRENTFEEWIDLGRILQRLLLKATEMGISYAFLNQPCEITTLASKLQEILPINKEYPTLILRIGYAEALSYSPRKDIRTNLISQPLI